MLLSRLNLYVLIVVIAVLFVLYLLVIFCFGVLYFICVLTPHFGMARKRCRHYTKGVDISPCIVTS